MTSLEETQKKKQIESNMGTVKSPLDSSSPYYLHPSDGPQITICPIVLRGENYNEWVRSMRNNFRAKNKLGFIDGTLKKPEAESAEEHLWVTVNSTLVGWIHNTLDPGLRSSVPQPDDVKDMWDDIRTRFSIGNGPRIHELKTLLSGCKQRGTTVVAYYNELRKIWDELEGYTIVPTCTCEAATILPKQRENEKVHDFLVGLDPNLYGNAVSNILMMEPLPSLNVVFAKLVTEERHHTIARSQENKSDAVGFAMQGASNKGKPQTRSGDKSKSNLFCSHCSKTGHDNSTCFQLHGYPEWWPSNIGQERGGGRSGRGGGRSNNGRGQVANAAITMNCEKQTSITATDRSGLHGLSDDQWATLVNMLNSKGQSSSTEKLNGPSFEDNDWSG